MVEPVRPPAALRSDDIGWRVLPMRGASVKVLRYDQETGGSTSLVRFEAGTRFPVHNHPAGEEIFVVGGDLQVLVTLPKPVEFLGS